MFRDLTPQGVSPERSNDWGSLPTPDSDFGSFWQSTRKLRVLLTHHLGDIRLPYFLERKLNGAVLNCFQQIPIVVQGCSATPGL